MTKILLLGLFISLFTSQTNERIDSYLSELHEDGKLNGNVLVIKNGKTLYEKSFGYSDGTKNTKLNKDYRFDIGSVYKEFPAVAIMQLKERNLINLEDKISKYIPELPKWAEKISVKHLLQYSSGLPKIHWNDYFAKGINITSAHLMNEIKSVHTLEFEPGSDYLYSNSNPILLIQIVEHISQTNFNAYLQQNLFDPFELNSTVVQDGYPYSDRTLMAIPFNANFEEDNFEISVKNLLFSSTARDMATWFEQLGDFNIVSKQSVQILSETVKMGENVQSPLGLGLWEADKIIEHSHHGSSANYECVVRRFKQDGITIVILTNQKHQNVYDISNELYAIIKKEI